MYATDRPLRTPTLWRTHGRTLAATLLSTALLLPGTGHAPPAPASPRGPLPVPIRPGAFRPAAEPASERPGARPKAAATDNRSAPEASPPPSAPMNVPVAFGLCGGFTAGLLALALRPRRNPGAGRGAIPAPPNEDLVFGEDRR